MPIATEVSIYVKRGDLIMGPFSEEQTVKRYHRGEFRDTDLAMIDGMTGWHPLATYIVDDADDAPPSFDASAPPPIPQNEPPPRFDLGDAESNFEAEAEPVAEVYPAPARSQFSFANPVGTAWALLGLGVMVMILSRWPYLLYVPLVLGAIGLAVQQLVRRNFVHGGPLLAVAVLAPLFLWLHWISPTRNAAKPIAAATPAPATPVPVVVPPPAVEPPKLVAETPVATPAPPAPEPPAVIEPAPVAKFKVGDYVAVTADTRLLFNGQEFRRAKAGERFLVLKVSADTVHLAARSTRGQIAVTASPDVLKSAPAPTTPVKRIIE